MAEMGLLLGAAGFFVIAIAVVMGLPLKYFLKKDQEMSKK